MTLTVIESRKVRLWKMFDEVEKLPPASSGLQAYAQLAETLNTMEDAVWGTEHWAPPRTFRDGRRTERLYPVYPESFFSVLGFPGVNLLLAKSELIFLSRFGAIEVQRKQDVDAFGTTWSFASRTSDILFQKMDYCGDGVWHSKNQR